MVFSDSSVEYYAHHLDGAGGLYRHEIHEVTFDYHQMEIDFEALMIEVKKVRPK